jgi:hypothetical protein
MDYIYLFDTMKRRPGTYLAGQTYAEAAAFVQGCDVGNNNTLLCGFREWLVVRLNGFDSSPWTSLVLRAAFPGEVVTAGDILGSKEKNKVAVDALFDLLLEFFRERGPQNEGLPKVYKKYAEWTRSRLPQRA